MEIAKKDTKVVIIENGTEKEINLVDLKVEQLPLVKLDGKEGKSITLKRALVAETPDNWVERRLFKYGDQDKRVMYDLTLPKTNQEAIKLFGDNVVEYVVKAVRVESDHTQMTGEGVDPATKALAKGISAGVKSGTLKPDQLAAIQAILAQAGIQGSAEAVVEKAKKDLKKSGFGK